MGNRSSAPKPSKGADANTAPGDCCPPGSLPAAPATALGLEGQSLRGAVLELGSDDAAGGSFRAYVVRPEKPDMPIVGCILLVHDLFGFDSARTHYVADDMTRGGYVVVAPDLFPANLSLLFRVRMAYDLVGKRLEEVVVPYIRTLTDAPILGLGFCWGAWALMRFNATGLLTCVVAAHPSVHLQKLQSTGPTMSDMFKQAKAPVLFLNTKQDPSSLSEGGYYMKILQSQESTRASSAHRYAAMSHGFANRGDLNRAKVKRDYEDFKRRALQEYAKYVAGAIQEP